MSHVFDIFLNIIEKAGPTFTALFVVYLTYKFSLKQNKIENKNDEYRKVRIITSNLIQIWRELSLIEFYTSSGNPYADLIFKDPKIAASYFDVDVSRINDFKQLFLKSKDEMKSINVSLFYALEHKFSEFNMSLKIFDSENTLQKTDDKDWKDVYETIFKNLVRDFERIILDTSSFLPLKEKKEISRILAAHQAELKKTQFDYEVPKFILDWLNKFIPLVEPITEEEVKIFMNDQTLKMIFTKFFGVVAGIFLKDNPIQTVRIIFEIIKSNGNSIDQKLNEEDIILQLELSEAENSMLQNNIAFYKLLYALYNKFDKSKSFEFKRYLIKLNNGTVNIKKELDIQKSIIISKRTLYSKDIVSLNISK